MPSDRPFCAIVGAGPAGLIAADFLARAGSRVTVYEAMPSPARKFLMAGRGGLNLTHSEELDPFLARYGAAAEWLAPYIQAFPPQSLRDFCGSLGENTFVGSSGRVFPKSFKTSPLLRALLIRLEQQSVSIETRTRWEGFANDRSLVLRDASGESRIRAADAIVLALGGASWPRLGSDGGWVRILAKRGIIVAPLAPANCGALVDWSERFRGSFEGQPVKTIAVRHGDQIARGDLVITRNGLEGGPVYTFSSHLAREISIGGEAVLHIDLRPDATVEALAQKLSRERGKQSTSSFLRKTVGLSKLEIALLREIRKELPSDARALASLIKDAPLGLRATAGFDRAISTSGGVAFEELDNNLMLKKIPGVFVAGEMLDFDAPTGGYLLQAAFSTGRAAALGAARYLGLEQPK